MGNILITGGTGLIGRKLTELLTARGHVVSHLGRTKRGDSNIRTFTWSIDAHRIEESAFDGVEAIIHLAGAGIADKRWTDERKREILESRTKSTRLLYEELKRRSHSVKTVVAASAIGFYGFDDEKKIFTEDSAAGDDFLAEVTRDWEKEIDAITDLGLRVVKIRTGTALSEKGGALMEIVKPVRWFAGAPLGSGRQFMSWIHVDDLCGIFIKAVEDPSLTGAYNGVAPNPVTNRVLTKEIARVLHKPLLLPPVPPFVLKILLGEMAALVLRGNRVSAKKILDAGYRFKFENIGEALQDLLGKK